MSETHGLRAKRTRSTARDLWQFLRTRKRWWLLPIILALVLLGILALVGQGSSAGPFIYTLF